MLLPLELLELRSTLGDFFVRSLLSDFLPESFSLEEEVDVLVPLFVRSGCLDVLSLIAGLLFVLLGESLEIVFPPLLLLPLRETPTLPRSTSVGLPSLSRVV